MANISVKSDHMEITVFGSKTDQCGLGQTLILPRKEEFCPYKLTCFYLHKMKFDMLENPFLFPPLKWNVERKCWLPKDGKSMSYTVAYNSFKTLLRRFKMSESNLSLHFMRIGATTDAFGRGIPGHIIDQSGRWKNPTTKHTYVKNGKHDVVYYTRFYT